MWTGGGPGRGDREGAPPNVMNSGYRPAGLALRLDQSLCITVLLDRYRVPLVWQRRDPGPAGPDRAPPIFGMARTSPQKSNESES
jgi:hypothetical protein